MSHLAIGHLYTALHAACACAVARVVEANGLDVSYIDLAADEREDALESGEIDLLVSFWTPEDNALLRPGREAIGVLYRPQASFAALATGEPASASAASAEASSASWKASDFMKLLVAEDAWSLVEKLRADHPDVAALPCKKIGEGALIDRVKEAGERGEKPLVVAWQPHAIFHSGLLDVLPDPQGWLGAPQEARLLLRSGLRGVLDEDMLDELSGMMLDNRVMSALDYAISVEGVDPEDAAEAWQRGRLLGR